MSVDRLLRRLLVSRTPRVDAPVPAGAPARDLTQLETLGLDRTDLERHLIYADWLQQRGAPRGELIAVQAALLHETDHHRLSGLRRREQALLAAHPGLGAPLSASVSVRWRLGFWDSLWVGVDLFGEQRDLNGLVERLIVHPSARFLREITVGLPDDLSYQAVVDTLVASQLRHLQSLHLGDFSLDFTDLSFVEIGALARLWRRHAGLRTVILQGGSFELGAMDLPFLEHLEIRTGGLTAESLGSLMACSWPRLRTLKLWFGDPLYGCTAALADLEPLWAGRSFPALEHLGLMNTEHSDAIARRLAQAPPILAQLRTLDLSLGTLSAQGVTHLRSAPLSHLDSLDLSDNYLAEVAGLEALAPLVVIGEQQVDHPDERSVSVGE